MTTDFSQVFYADRGFFVQIALRGGPTRQIGPRYDIGIHKFEISLKIQANYGVLLSMNEDYLFVFTTDNDLQIWTTNPLASFATYDLQGTITGNFV